MRIRLSPFQLAKWHRNNNWAVPDARTLQGFADHTFDVMIPHMLFSHMPLFRLESTSPALAFAFCIIGGVLMSEPAHHRARGDVASIANGSRSEQAESQPPALSSSSAESSAGSDRIILGDTWDAAPTVRDEVMAHLVKVRDRTTVRLLTLCRPLPSAAGSDCPNSTSPTCKPWSCFRRHLC
jgi:hypothetical protein